MSMSARILLSSSAVLLAASITTAAVLTAGVSLETSPRPEPQMAAPPAPVYVSPAPVAFDLEGDSPAEL
jgi:hypothetical protein